ncbi:hypothetical protein SKB0092_17760 [Roseomonas mucosa]
MRRGGWRSTPPRGRSGWRGEAPARRIGSGRPLFLPQRREYRDHRLDWMIRSGGIEVVLAGLRDNNIRFSWPE